MENFYFYCHYGVLNGPTTQRPVYRPTIRVITEYVNVNHINPFAPELSQKVSFMSAFCQCNFDSRLLPRD